MTDYTLITKFRNQIQGEYLINKLKEKNKTCYNFFEKPADINHPENSADDQMKIFEETKDFYNDEYFKLLFKRDLDGLKNAKKVIFLLPAGYSVHIEAGIAYGLGKHLILIGKPEKPESLYLIFKERYETIDDFLATI